MRKSFVKLISTLFPSLVVSFAYNQLTNPQVKKLRKNEIAVLDKSHKEIYKFHDFDIQLYTWHGGEDKILLIHGWEGQAGNFSDFIPKLIENNYTVYAFDALSHGFSSNGKTSIFDFANLVGLLIQHFNVKKLISHSFGGVATTYSLQANQHINIEKYVLITTPDKFTERIDDIANQIGITNKVIQKLINKIEIETKLDVKKLNVSDFVSKVNVEKSLIIHDKNDGVLSINLSRSVHKNWPNSQLVEIDGTGHFKILRTDFVIEMAINFLKT